MQFKQVSAGWGHSAALTTDGVVVIFGRPYEFSTLFQMHRIYRISPFLARKISISTNSTYFGSLITKFLGTFNRESLKDIGKLNLHKHLTITFFESLMRIKIAKDFIRFQLSF